MILKTHRNLVSVSCLLFALLTFANTNGENQEGISSTRNRSKRQTSNAWPRDCYDVRLTGETISGVYTIHPYQSSGPVNVYCDLRTDGGGWTVFLQRKLRYPLLNFTRTFDDYANFFGDANGEYWLGNNVLHDITSYTDFTLMVKATNDHGEVRTAEWGSFSVGDEQSNFKLSISNYLPNSTLGDGMTPTGRNSSAGRPFSTYNQIDPGTPKHCLSYYGNGGWWYNDCLGVNPTATTIPIIIHPTDTATTWFYWKTGSKDISPEVLSEIQFKIRPLHRTNPTTPSYYTYYGK